MLQRNVLKNKLINIKFGALVAISFLLCVTPVSADELVITGNGAGSTSDVATTSNQNTNVTQSNTTTSSTEVTTDSNTGNNMVSENTGGTSTIVSGNVTTDVLIENSGNVNASSADCCIAPAETTGVIAGNGAGSVNYLQVISNSTSSIVSNNTAVITNNIIGIANTGNNSASNNSHGDVLIKTGNINVSEKIMNGPLNFNNAGTAISGSSMNLGGYELKISGNGSFSKNNINLDINNDTNVSVNNAIDILNESVWLLSTGYNKASSNVGGNVSILIGDINFLSDIVNGPINVNSVKVTCCDEKEPEQQNPTTTPPPATHVESKPSESKSSDSPKGGEVLAAAIGSILPATGNYNFLLFLMGNVAMLLLGMILRLRSGRSPGLFSVAV